jgi:hypothetical protein
MPERHYIFSHNHAFANGFTPLTHTLVQLLVLRHDTLHPHSRCDPFTKIVTAEVLPLQLLLPLICAILLLSFLFCYCPCHSATALNHHSTTP